MAEAMNEKTGGGNGARIAWLAGAVLLLIGPITFWSGLDPLDRWHRPESPLDRTNGHFAPQWRFLEDATTAVPPGQTFTVWGPTPDDEMAMFMMALALFPREVPLPSSYWKRPREEYGGVARYVLSLRCDQRNERALEEVARFDEGCVYRRLLPE